MRRVNDAWETGESGSIVESREGPGLSFSGSVGSAYSGTDCWIKVKNPAAPAVRLEAKEEVELMPSDQKRLIV
jgi:hypothetical protein